MKAIMVMYDSLNRHMLPNYGCDWTIAPNFHRLGKRSVTFDTAFVGSMPCIPARRELHTARYNFLHRSWGPFEPFDDSAIEIIGNNGIYTHLVSDHLHYWQDGGATYHGRYNSWENVRGQEGDKWKGEVENPKIPKHLGRIDRQDWINRKYMSEEELTPQAKTFKLGLDFISKNHKQDNWFLQIETFDPHEPFFTVNKWKGHYPHKWDGPHFDWPFYDKVTETRDAVKHLRFEYAALLTQCDHYLGTVIDAMDKYDLWSDTLLIVNTDHGFLLGEHDWWAKIRTPWYNELANIPLFVWDPRYGVSGKNRKSLVQTIDIAATLLDFFSLELTPDMEGKNLGPIIEKDSPIREAGIFGIFGGHVNVTDGRYVFMKAPLDPKLSFYHYTHMPAHLNSLFSLKEMQQMEVHKGFSFTKGCPVMKIPALGPNGWEQMQPFVELKDLLFDNKEDYEQLKPIKDAKIELKMKRLMIDLMERNDAPPEVYKRLGLK